MNDTGIPLSGADWLIDLGTVGHGAKGQVNASATERAGVARQLGLLQCDSFKLSYHIAPTGKEHYRVRASLTAEIVQSCVVSLVPIKARIAESSESLFVPADELVAANTAEEPDALSAPVIEGFDNGRIDLGRLAYELLSVSIDPYPRAEDAELPQGTPAVKAPPSPFSVLSRLRKD